jgi:ABC-type transport system involved in multi-copper enzyme maturation permease subunit
MTDVAAPIPQARVNPVLRVARRLARGLHGFWTGISAVSVKELRGRMRGGRAFAVLTIYLLLLAALAFGIYFYLRQQALLDSSMLSGGNGFSGGTQGYALSASVGHAIFSGLLLVETLLVLVLAPALTTGAISMEREKGTIDMLVTTPLSTLGMVVGKLFSALSYVFLLIFASVPLMATVFVFGGVGPEDVLRAYVVLLSLAFGMGAVGLFISALVRRTQTATVLTFIVVLALTLGASAVHQLWTVMGSSVATAPQGSIAIQTIDHAPQQLVWLNPFVSDLDLICTTAPGGYEPHSCDYVAGVTGTPWFGASLGGDCSNGSCSFPVIKRDTTGPMIMGGPAIRQGPMVAPAPVVQVMPIQANTGGGFAVAIDPSGPVLVSAADAPPCPPGADCAAAPTEPVTPASASFGFPRDTFWPQSAAAFVVLGVVLMLLSSQLVSPTRRLHLPRRGRRDRSAAPA